MPLKGANILPFPHSPPLPTFLLSPSPSASSPDPLSYHSKISTCQLPPLLSTSIKSLPISQPTRLNSPIYSTIDSLMPTFDNIQQQSSNTINNMDTNSHMNFNNLKNNIHSFIGQTKQPIKKLNLDMINYILMAICLQMIPYVLIYCIEECSPLVLFSWWRNKIS